MYKCSIITASSASIYHIQKFHTCIKIIVYSFYEVMLFCKLLCKLNGFFVFSWCHQMETLSMLLAICTGNSPISGEFSAQRPVTRALMFFFDLSLNKRLSKQSSGWWFETPSRLLWCHCNVQMIYIMTDVVILLKSKIEDNMWYVGANDISTNTTTIRRWGCPVAPFLW